jgi:hypothetical protein
VSPRRLRAAFAFTALLLLHDPIIALTGSAVLAHALLGFGLLWFTISRALGALMSRGAPWVGGLSTFVATWVLAALGAWYSLMDQGSVNVKLQFLATFVLIPLLWAAFSELAGHPRWRRSLGRLLLFYVATELAIMALQVSYFLVGVGIAPSEFYESMIPGSQFNGNNLAAIVVMLSIFYNATSHQTPRRERGVFNAIVVVILLITFSRLAMLLYIADRIRNLNLRQMGNVLLAATVLLAGAIAINDIDYTGNETIDASLYKAKSLATIAEVGLNADRSTSSRGESYFNFFDQIGRLGMGSGAILDYSTFTSGAVFADEALYINPHSMVVEFGYWMGWPGLLALGAFMLIGYVRPSQGTLAQRGFVLIAVLFASSIPSSAIPLPPLWAGFLLLAMLGAFGPDTRASARVPARIPKLARAHQRLPQTL